MVWTIKDGETVSLESSLDIKGLKIEGSGKLVTNGHRINAAPLIIEESGRIITKGYGEHTEISDEKLSDEYIRDIESNLQMPFDEAMKLKEEGRKVKEKVDLNNNPESEEESW